MIDKYTGHLGRQLMWVGTVSVATRVTSAFSLPPPPPAGSSGGSSSVLVRPGVRLTIWCTTLPGHRVGLQTIRFGHAYEAQLLSCLLPVRLSLWPLAAPCVYYLLPRYLLMCVCVCVCVEVTHMYLPALLALLRRGPESRLCAAKR